MRYVIGLLVPLSLLVLSGLWLDSAGAQALCTPMGADLECTELGGNSAHVGDTYTVPGPGSPGSGSMIVPDRFAPPGVGREVAPGLRAVPGPSYEKSWHRVEPGSIEPMREREAKRRQGRSRYGDDRHDQ